MFRKFADFMDWTLTINPAWVGFVVSISTVISITAVLFFGVVALVTVTHGWVLLLVPALIVYAWYVALFKQRK